MEEKPMELKGWFAVSWIAASFVTLVGLAIGALVGSKFASSAASTGFVRLEIPDCATFPADSARGDIAIPQTADPNANLGRVLCAGDTLHWHDRLRRPFTVAFTSADCTSNTTPPAPPVPASGDSVLDVATLPLSSSPTGTYRYCTYTFVNLGYRDYPPAHIIIMK
jgi:hypothetical protein